jgi:hypothetical protein
VPPYTIDPTELWAAIDRLADERDQSWRFTKKGDKRPAYDVETAKAARRKNLRAKQDVAIDRILAEANKRNRRRASPEGSIADRMLRAMEPGKYYGQGDLARLAGEGRSSRAKVHQVMLRKGWIEKVRNPAWCGNQFLPWEIAGGAEPQPQHLYRLTHAGLAKRQTLG